VFNLVINVFVEDDDVVGTVSTVVAGAVELVISSGAISFDKFIVSGVEDSIIRGGDVANVVDSIFLTI
jgi:hypothetical protein